MCAMVTRSRHSSSTSEFQHQTHSERSNMKSVAPSVHILHNLIRNFSRDPTIISAINSLRQQLYDYGFDIFHEFPIQCYNQKVAATSDRLGSLDEYGHDKTHSILIGNTKHLWPIFIDELTRNRNQWQHESSPLNQYTWNCLEKCCDQCLKQNGIDYTVRYTFQMEEDKLVAFQRLCHHAHYAYLDPISHLCIHHQYGPWTAMRAVIVLNAEYYDSDLDEKESAELISPCSEFEMENVQRQWNEIKKVLFDKRHDDCKPQPADSWKYWLKMRDAYDIGREYRYSDDQILYHYTTDTKVLDSIIERELVKSCESLLK